MVIVGYQGIGKSGTAKDGNGFIDLESSNFFVDGKRPDDWYKPYCQIAVHLSSQGYYVFTSSHEVVRKELLNYDVRRLVVYPSLELKDAWIQRLTNRYELTKEPKDYRALMNARDRFEENINELANADGFEKLVLAYMPFDLGKVIRAYEEEDGI
jgi:hypothetical protein